MTSLPFAVLLALASSAGLSAATYSAVLDQESHHQGSSITQFLPSLTPTFSDDMSSDKSLQLILSAPAGYHFLFTPTGGPSELSIRFAVYLTNPLQDAGAQSGGQVQLEGLTGSAPTLTPRFAYYFDGSFDVVIAFPRTLSSSITFQALRLNLTVPSSFNTSFSNVTPSVAIFFNNTDGFNTTQQAFLEADTAATPEPSTTVFFLTGAALFAVGRRRIS